MGCLPALVQAGEKRARTTGRRGICLRNSSPPRGRRRSACRARSISRSAVSGSGSPRDVGEHPEAVGVRGHDRRGEIVVPARRLGAGLHREGPQLHRDAVSVRELHRAPQESMPSSGRRACPPVSRPHALIVVTGELIALPGGRPGSASPPGQPRPIMRPTPHVGPELQRAVTRSAETAELRLRRKDQVR